MNHSPAPVAPRPLLIAAALTLLEGLFFVGYGVLELVHLSTDRLSMGLTTSAFFLGYGALLGWCARGLRDGGSWARSPVVFAQLLQILVAWSFFGGETKGVAAGIFVVSVAVLIGIMLPSSLKFLADEDTRV
ncbi:hypothetical protein NODU109028_18705 [Nocardioides dubius]|uniref:Uncharacterized protein n=1 Tax=Nocardioides dubius TaxID=317019 RepID=A0ABN1TJP5_9ACTN